MHKFPSHKNYSGVHLFNETTGTLPVDEKDVQKINSLIENYETCTFQLIEVAFVDETKIIQINKKHLDHNNITDIITFRYDENDDKNAIEGTLFCCADQIIRQARKAGGPVKNEFCRIIIHGFLHLCGYDDTSKKQKERMTEREDFYLNQLF